MPADLDDLLADAAKDPTEPIDTDALWSSGRRRRLLRRASAVFAGVASIAVAAVAIGSIGLQSPSTPEVAPLDEPDPTEDAGIDGDAVEDEVEDDAPAPVEEPEPEQQEEASDDADLTEEPATEEEPDAQVETAEDPGPVPDEAAMADPCAGHDEADMSPFIDVVGPVAGQQVDGQIELVGCGRVFEATVRYRLLDGDTVLVDDFTTATAGGPELGEFRTTIPVDVSGELTLEVFWESAADGSEQDLVEVVVQAS